MSYEGQAFSGDQSQNSGTCHRGGITHDQVFTERNISRPATRCQDDSVVVNGDIYLGDAPSAPQRHQVRRIERQDTYRNDDRNLDSRYSESQTRYGDNYTGSNSRRDELQQQDYYYRQQQNQQRYYEGPPPHQYGINPGQLIAGGIGGAIGMALLGGHHGREGYYHRGNPGLGFLAGSMIGVGLAGGDNSYSGYDNQQQFIGRSGWGAPPPMYHYRHESPQQRFYEMQRERQQTQAYRYNYSGNQDYATSDNW